MGSKRPKVLIVDDEQDIVLALFDILFQDNGRYDVLLASTAEIAQQILTELPIDVIVTDVNLPEKSGMELLSWAALECPDTRVIVMTAFDVTGIRDRAHAFGCLRMMRKPFDGSEMRAAILQALDRRDGFAGTLSELSAVDVLQMLCIARKTTALRFSENGRSGTVYIERGELVDAVWDGLVGEEAVYRMVVVKNGVFHTSPFPADIERTITSDWQYLLMEGLRRADEAARDREGDAPAPRAPSAPHTLRSGEVGLARSTVGSWLAIQRSAAQPPSTEPVRSLPRLIDEGFDLLRAGRRDEARTAWEEALRLDPGNRRIEINLRTLDGARVATARR
jgi:DNA-binding response OmpR family regulator